MQDKHQPGAGLPSAEGFFLRYMAAPPMFLLSPQATSTKRFQSFGQKFITISESMSADCLQQVVTTKRPFALEHSSTSWSVAMVLEHLLLVGDVINTVMEALVNDEPPQILVSTAAVKPTGQLEMPIEKFKSYVGDYVTFANGVDIANAKKVRHLHPWFGELSASQWHAFSWMHEWIHYRQVEKIMRQLPSGC